jgi:predicted nucleic acid-binding Zn ribbon protein
MINPNRRGPKPLNDILGELFAARGFGRLRARKELEDAWNAAVGEPASRQTRLGEVRRGVLNVTVAHSALLEELAAFRKPELLAALRETADGTVIHDIRFRVGSLEADIPGNPPGGTPRPGRGRPRR